jgi:hypothetical protein
MPTSSFYKFNCFNEDLAKGVHQLHAAGHTLKAYLTNNTPNAASHAVKADLAGITEGAGFGYDPIDIENDVTTGEPTLVTAGDKTWTASGGSFGPFRYAVIYNDTATGDPLIGYFDYGSGITVGDGESFALNFGASLLSITVS